MNTPTEQQQTVLQRVVAACESDTRVVAAFLGGSFAAGRADEQSDLDIYLITTLRRTRHTTTCLPGGRLSCAGWASLSSWKTSTSSVSTCSSSPLRTASRAN